MIGRWLCAIGIHVWEHTDGCFAFCVRPSCSRVVWFPGTWYWDLDICDTRKVYDKVDVQ